MLDQSTSTENLQPDQDVHKRYAEAANQREEALCCPVDYAPQYLDVIPEEILQRDYGCGDPSPYVTAGDTVLDLGSGGGKLCYIAAQVAGSAGRVIGVDCNSEMLALARKYRSSVADRLGYDNVQFHFGRIQDLRLDLEALAAECQGFQITSPDDVLRVRQIEDRLRRESPMIASDSVDCVVSNCVLNLVRPADRKQLFTEIFRVLKRGGRAAISDIVADETVPDELKQNGHLWSGCISGAWREDQFLKEFEDAGFHGLHIATRQDEPWQTVQGIEFRSMTVLAYKGKHGPCLERNQAVVYRGPFRSVTDDDGHVYIRGERTAVCDKTFHLLQQGPYADRFIGISPYEEIALENAAKFDCSRDQVRSPRESKGPAYRATFENQSGPCGDSAGPCC